MESHECLTFYLAPFVYAVILSTAQMVAQFLHSATSY